LELCYQNMKGGLIISIILLHTRLHSLLQFHAIIIVVCVNFSPSRCECYNLSRFSLRKCFNCAYDLKISNMQSSTQISLLIQQIYFYLVNFVKCQI